MIAQTAGDPPAPHDVPETSTSPAAASQKLSLYASPWKGSALRIGSKTQEWNAYVKQNYRLNDISAALDPFWDGSGSYTVRFTDQNGHDVFSPTQYLWQVEGGTPFIPSPYTQADSYKFLLDDKTVDTKDLHLDFGMDGSGYPRTSTIRVNITGDTVDSFIVPAKFIIHWNLPRWYVTVPEPVTTVTGEHDPDRPSGPVDPDNNPNSNEFTDIQTVQLYREKQKEFIQTGAIYIGAALEAEKDVAEFYATGPLYELGAGAVTTLLGKAAEASRTALVSRQYAADALATATTAERLASEGVTAGKSSEEIGELNSLAASARSKADEANEAAAKADTMAANARATAGEIGRLPLPPTPAGMTNAKFGEDVMKWGTGYDAAITRMGNVTAQEMRDAGVTKEMAQAWMDFYTNELVRTGGINPSAAGRMLLMQRVVQLLS